MKGIVFFRVLSVLWAMLNTRRRWMFCLLVFFLLIAGILETGGMLFIFGFIAGLRVDPTTGQRGGRVAHIVQQFYGQVLDNREYVLIVGGLVLLIIAIRNVLGILAHFGLTRFLMKLNQRVSESLFAGYLLTPLEQINDRGVSSLGGKISRIFDVFSVSFSGLAQIIADALMLAMVLCLLMLINPTITIVGALLFGIVGALTYLVIQRQAFSMGREAKQAERARGRHLKDGLRGIIDVRLREARSQVLRDYALALQRSALLKRRTQILERLPRSVNEMTLAFIIVASVGYLSFGEHSIEDALPTLAIFGFAGLRMTAAMSRVNRSFQRLKRNSSEFEEHYFSIMEVAPETFRGQGMRFEGSYLADETTAPSKFDLPFQQTLSLHQVTYSYPSSKTPVIQGVSLEIPRGGFVSFCGTSGGGKSTLALLLMGLLRPQEGQVLCDGLDVFRHIRSWHRKIGYVGQNMYLSKRSIRENVAFTVPEEQIDDERVWKALQLASAHTFVRRLPKKLHYRLTEGGANLSGGQRQRLIIARALYSDPEIIVFDEATAALDNVTERAIAKSIADLSQTKTIICIAHRLSTIAKSDVIHVVEAGKITASGNFETLMQTSATFQKLANEEKKKKQKKKTPPAPTQEP